MDRPTAPELTALLEDEAFYAGDPFPTYARLRAEAPVVWHQPVDGPGWWVVSTLPEVLEVSRDPGRFCSGKGILTFEIGVEYPSPPTMMHTDPPDHTRYRKLVQPGFAPSKMRALEEPVRALARRFVDELPTGEPVDIVTGPGNNYVAAAKRAVAGVVGIDSEAGATEILVVADETADPRLVAVDLVSQAEHDEQAAAVLVTTSAELAELVDAETARVAATTRHHARVAAVDDQHRLHRPVPLLHQELPALGEVAAGADLDDQLRQRHHGSRDLRERVLHRQHGLLEHTGQDLVRQRRDLRDGR